MIDGRTRSVGTAELTSCTVPTAIQFLAVRRQTLNQPAPYLWDKLKSNLAHCCCVITYDEEGHIVRNVRNSVPTGVIRSLLTAVIMKNIALWKVTPCSLVLR
jgi:hypothetical protein